MRKLTNCRNRSSMENSTFDTTNCSNLIHELLQKQRQIETEFEIDLNRSIIEEEETYCFGDEFVPIFNHPDNADEAIDNANEAIENAEDAIHNAENQVVPDKSIDSNSEQTTKTNATEGNFYKFLRLYAKKNPLNT